MSSAKVTPPKSSAASTVSSEDVILIPTPLLGSTRVGSTIDSVPPSHAEKLSGLGDDDGISAEKKLSGLGYDDGKISKQQMEDLSKMITQVNEKPSFSDPDGTLLKRSKEIMTLVKFAVMGGLLGLKYYSLLQIHIHLLTASIASS